ncbi:hydroxysteroid dehydrogenase-like protein 2 [Cricetulus griseus]|uniref:Hydroxysteroid dehydrogenase-like protein 2 n=1 Tax=Cricetulus griseus TaxID=10029 RepID=A0A9J7FFR6_CRIGR|nr:hydroxysteroid dehydrogenase-like protein 2 [Cricetulus griseus]
MLPNTGKLAGCTIFITGASRGIGKAIALKAAKDGANIVIAAKTTQTHPKLPGTIYTAAEEIEAVGGKALPCVVDVRDEQQINNAVEKAVEKFGGIDILVNNASAISLTNTLDTPTKRVDLMMNVNTRGTYLTSKACIPFLRKSKVAHILNLSPPLNLNPLWFKQHCAYTIAKYGMSMCVLGMAEEFRGEIAVNALWPKTAIHTAAMDMLGGSGVESQCRKADIIADAAYSIFKRPKSFTGNFIIDENILKEEGINNFDVYAITPGHPLIPDFFLDEFPDAVIEETISHDFVPEVKEEKPQQQPPPQLQPQPSPQLQPQPSPQLQPQPSPQLQPQPSPQLQPQPSPQLQPQPSPQLQPQPSPQLQPQPPPQLQPQPPPQPQPSPLLQPQPPPQPQPQPPPHFGAVEETFRILKDSLSDDVVKATQAVYQFELSGEDGGTWFLDLKSKGGKVGHGESSERADVVMSMTTDDFVKMFSGKLKPTMAFMSGKLKIKGNMALAIKLEKLMTQMNSRL